jgi:hypothetical protein
VELDDKFVSKISLLMIKRRPEIDDYSCDCRHRTDCSSPHGNDRSAIHNQPFTRMSQLETGKIEYQTVRMLERAHISLHRLTKRDLHLDTVCVFGERDRNDCRMRSGTSGVLRNGGSRGQAGQKHGKTDY